MVNNSALQSWVDEVARLTQPSKVVWCNGSEAEYQGLVKEMLAAGTLTELDQAKWPGCYHHKSDVNDVARVEHLTFICCENKDDAGPIIGSRPPRCAT
jgi:phosphoenolpyruvate carboxykinase (GTP)